MPFEKCESITLVHELAREVPISSTDRGELFAALGITPDGNEFDVVVLDLRLPDMKDWSLLATIRQLQPDASIVLMTAFGTDEVVERAIALGVCSVLTKPFELGEHVDAVYGVTELGSRLALS